MGADKNGATYNINADSAASAVAIHMRARKLILLTDVAGVLDEKNELVLTLTPEKLSELKAKNLISGGMIPKIDCCLAALSKGCGAASIIDGRTPHLVLLEIFTHRGSGTEIKI